MFSSLQELLILVLLILALIIIPRLMTARKQPQSTTESTSVTSKFRLSGPVRLYVVLTIAWPLVSAAFLKPWQNDPFHYILIGIAPVILLWAIVWICGGFRSPE